MSMLRGRRWWALALVPGLLILAASLSPAVAEAVSSASPRASVSCDGPKLGQHIYDCAGVLSLDEIATLEADAAAVEHAGAPTVVYLQARDSTADVTLQDARDLMARWDIQSHSGARDGFVMFFNLEPGNLQHGTVALYAGEKHYHGNLPQSELDRIREDVMTPLLADGKTAEGIAAGLQQVAHDLRSESPVDPARPIAAFLGRLPINLLALLIAGVVALLVVPIYRQQSAYAKRADASAGLSIGAGILPGDMPPGIVGALINGHVTNAHIEATVLDFARRGLLEIHPIGAKDMYVQLLSDGKGLTGYEAVVWDGLEAHASEENRTLSQDDMARATLVWKKQRTALQEDLITRGWYDPAAASARRRPLYIAGIVGVVALSASVALLVISREGWAAIGLIVALIASVVAFACGQSIPDTSVEGDLAAVPWSTYRARISDHSYQPSLDTDLPYIVALGLVGKLTHRLKAESERGYSPSWFRVGEQGQNAYPVGPHYYPYFVAFHSSMGPVTGGGARGGYSGGGAAGGGGGSAGSF